jgi:hypothetical protein
MPGYVIGTGGEAGCKVEDGAAIFCAVVVHKLVPVVQVYLVPYQSSYIEFHKQLQR